MSAVIPDIIIANTLNSGLKILRDDYTTHLMQGDVYNSLLYILFKDVVLGNYDMFENIVELLVTTHEHPRHIFIRSSFDQNLQNNSAPQIVVTNPSESPINDSIGIGEGDQDDYLITNIDGDPEYLRQFSRNYLSTYRVLILTQNRNETTLLYHLIKMTIVSLTNHFSLCGLINLKIGGDDLKLHKEPGAAFAKSVTMTFQYKQVVPELYTTGIFQKIRVFWKADDIQTTLYGPLDISADSDSDSDFDSDSDSGSDS